MLCFQCDLCISSMGILLLLLKGHVSSMLMSVMGGELTSTLPDCMLSDTHDVWSMLVK